MKDKIKNSTDVLNSMMSDLVAYTGALGPGPYWIDNQKSTLDWLQKNDLSSFRKYDRYSKALSNFGGGSRWRLLSDINNEIHAKNYSKIYYLAQKLHIKPVVNLYRSSIRDLARESYSQKMLVNFLAKICKLRDDDNELDKIESSVIGMPSDLINIEGKLYTPKFLDEFLKYLDMKKHIDFSTVKNYLEIGPGVGTFPEVLAKLFTNLRLYLIDIPPQLYITQQFLCAIFPGQVATYEQISADPEILKSKDYRIFILAPWQIDMLEFEELQLAFNQVSFSEMKKETVESYLSYMNKWNTQNINIRAIDKNKTKEGPSFEDYVNSLPDYDLVSRERNNNAIAYVNDELKKKKETRSASALYFKRKNV